MSDSLVKIDFTNTGNEIVTISYNEPGGDRRGPIVIRPNQVIRRELEISFSYFFTFGRGRQEQTASQNFTNNSTVDVNKYFV